MSSKTLSNQAAAFTPYTLRPVRNEDAALLIALIDGCFREYEAEGVVIDLDDLDADLYAMRSKIDAEKGEFWLLFDGDILLASIGVAPVDHGKFDKGQVCELKRLYMRSNTRGQGLAEKLLHLVEQWAQDRGASHMNLWTDTRFSRAHNFYEKHGYDRQAETRDLGDISNTTEYEYIKKLR